MKEKAAIYARVWAPDEDISAPVCYLRQLARQRGFEVVAEYKDIASGAKARRPGLDALLADAKQGRFSIVLTNRLASLGLSGNATEEEIKQVYKDLVKVWHPDRFSENDDRLRRKADQRLKEINEAYSHISKHWEPLRQ